MRHTPRIYSLLLVMAGAVVGPRAQAQQPFDLDTTFRTAIDSWYVSSIAPLPDGSILLSGRVSFPGDPIGIFRFMSKVLGSGDKDPLFPSGVPGGGRLTPWDGRFYVGTNTLVRRIWPDGILDNDFILMNADPLFSSLQGGDYHVYPDGRVLMGGVHDLHDTIRGYTGLHCLIWFSNTGYLDTTKTHRKCAGALFRFRELPDGKFIGSGSTSTWDGQPTGSNIIRFHPDGALDTTFQANVVWGQAYGFLPLDDGRVYAAGRFRIAGNADTLRLVRFMPNGILDPTFNLLDLDAVEQSGSAPVAALYQLNDDRLIVTGGFDRVEGEMRRGICLIDTSGFLVDDHFTGPGCGGYDYMGLNYGSLSGITPAPDGSYYIWGAYHGYDDGTTNDTLQRMVSRLHGLEVGLPHLAAPPPTAHLRLHPNPATLSGAEAWVAMDYDLLVPPQDAAILIRDMTGREVKRFLLRDTKQQVVWDTRSTAPGSYTVTLQQQGRQLRTEKLIIRP